MFYYKTLYSNDFLESAMNSFTIASNGDFLLTVNEPTIFKVGLEEIPV